MPSAADFHLQVVLPSADDGGLHVGFMQGGDDEEGFTCRARVEPEVPDVRLENGGVGGVGRSEDGRRDWVGRTGMA